MLCQHAAGRCLDSPAFGAYGCSALQSSEPAAPHQAVPATAQGAPRQVCVAVDDSPAAQQALLWAVERLVTPCARASLLHVASVAHSVPFPVRACACLSVDWVLF